MNGLDVAVVLIILTTVTVGFIRGFVQQAAELIVLYMVVVLAAQYHLVLGGWLSILFTADPEPLAGVAFLGVFASDFLFLSWVVRRVFPDMRIASLGFFDNILGSVAGVATGVVVACVSATVLLFVVAAPWPGYEGSRIGLGQLAAESFLMPYITQYAPALYSAITPWFPGGVPAIFAPFI